jgi:Fucose permease
MKSVRAIFAAACLGMLTFGIVLTILGAVLPEIIEQFGIDKAQAGSLFLLMTFAILAASLAVGPLVDRYGYKGMLLLGTALIAAGLEGIAFAPSMFTLRSAIVFIGFGGGIINGGTTRSSQISVQMQNTQTSTCLEFSSESARLAFRSCSQRLERASRIRR